MKIHEIEGMTRTIGESQGYAALHIRDAVVTVNAGENETETLAMFSEWVPSEEDLERLNAGGRVRLGILGVNHPPILIDTVGK